MNFTLFTTVFLCIGWIVEVAGNERPSDCCFKVKNTKISPDNIVDYSIQEPPLCSIRAVRFYTKKKKVICSDPNSDWAKQMIMKFYPTTKPFQCHTKTIQTTKHNRPGTQTETSTSTTVQPTVTVINTSGPEISTSTTTATSEAETSTSTTITTSRPETIRSTTVKTIKSSQLETENSQRNTKNSKTSPHTSLNTMTTCGTDEPMTTTKEKKLSSNAVTSTTPAKRTNPSWLKLKARKKSKKELRKLQMGKKPRN